MKLYVGGRAQGKLKCALEGNDIEKVTQATNSSIDDLVMADCIYKLNDWIWKNNDEKKVNELCDRLIEENAKAIVVCDEVGYGVVPIDKNERLYRELVGRTLIRLAYDADEVYRVVCGIAMRIK